jgi:hypothetical protein
MKQLRIVNRSERFVVQENADTLFSKKWRDMINCYNFSGSERIPLAIFDTVEQAEQFCEKQLQEMPMRKDTIVKTYNTGLHDMVCPNTTPMPKCEPPKTLLGFPVVSVDFDKENNERINELTTALNRAAYTLFKIKRMQDLTKIQEFASYEHSLACGVIDKEIV